MRNIWQNAACLITQHSVSRWSTHRAVLVNTARSYEQESLRSPTPAPFLYDNDVKIFDAFFPLNFKRLVQVLQALACSRLGDRSFSRLRKLPKNYQQTMIMSPKPLNN